MSKKSKKRKKKPIRLAQIGRFSYLSSHAVERLRQRTQMTPDEMNHLLDHNGYFKLGSHAGFYRIHLLFYSPKDDNFFVAIQDERMGKVVTILPINYHDKLAWRITPEECEQAKQKFEAYDQARKATPSVKNTQPPTLPPKPKAPTKLANIRFVYRLNNHEDENSRLEFIQKEDARKKPKFLLCVMYIGKDLRTRRKQLLTVDASIYDNEISKLWQDDELIQKIDRVIQRKNLLQESIFLLEVLNRDRVLLNYLEFRDKEQSYRFMEKYLVKLQMMYDLLKSLDFNEHNRVLLPKWQNLVAIEYRTLPAVNKKPPSKKQIAWAIFVAILLGLLYKLVKQRIKKFFSLK